MNAFIQRPLFFHGLMAAIGLFAVKFTFYLSHHWEYNLSPIFLFSSWLFIMTAVVMAGLAERKQASSFGFWRALSVCLIVIAMALFGALLAEQILYRLVDTSLGDQMKQADMSMTLEMLQKNNMIPEMEKNRILAIKSKTRPEDYYSLTYALSFFFAKFIGNGLFALVIAGFWLRIRPKADRPTVV